MTRRLRHQVALFDEDYEYLVAEYGGSWATYVRSFIHERVVEMRRVRAVAIAQVPVHVVSDIDTPRSGGPRHHGRHGWYVRASKPGDHVIRQLVVYAAEDSKASACQRAIELLTVLGHEDWSIRGDDYKHTCRGNDIEIMRKAEGVA